MELFELSAIEAAKKLNSDFNLSISFKSHKNIPKPKYNEDAEIREIRWKKRERFEKWENDAWQTIHDYLWLMREWIEKYSPSTNNDFIDNRFHYANINYHRAEEFSISWIQQLSDEEKVEWKWVVDKMRIFLDKHKKDENPQNPEIPSTHIVNLPNHLNIY